MESRETRGSVSRQVNLIEIQSINRCVLRRCMYSSWISIKLTCLNTDPLVSLDSILFLFHFRIHGGVEIKIWWRIEGEIDA